MPRARFPSAQGEAPMIVLSRKKNESVVINDNITVTVVDIRGDKVRLGIVSPKEVPVYRQEVFDALHGRDPVPVVISRIDPTPPPPAPVMAPTTVQATQPQV